MKNRLRLWRRAAALTGATALVAGVAVLAPVSGASAHKAASKCGNKQIKISPAGGASTKIPVEAIITEGGVSCATAFKLIGFTLEGKTPKPWKFFQPKTEPPEGLFEQGLKNGSKKIEYAIHPG